MNRRGLWILTGRGRVARPGSPARPAPVRTPGPPEFHSDGARVRRARPADTETWGRSRLPAGAGWRGRAPRGRDGTNHARSAHDRTRAECVPAGGRRGASRGAEHGGRVGRGPGCVDRCPAPGRVRDAPALVRRTSRPLEPRHPESGPRRGDGSRRRVPVCRSRPGPLPAADRAHRVPLRVARGGRAPAHGRAHLGRSRSRAGPSRAGDGGGAGGAAVPARERPAGRAGRGAPPSGARATAAVPHVRLARALLRGRDRGRVDRRDGRVPGAAAVPRHCDARRLHGRTVDAGRAVVGDSRHVRRVAAVQPGPRGGDLLRRHARDPGRGVPAPGRAVGVLGGGRGRRGRPAFPAGRWQRRAARRGRHLDGQRAPRSRPARRRPSRMGSFGAALLPRRADRRARLARPRPARPALRVPRPIRPGRPRHQPGHGARDERALGG